MTNPGVFDHLLNRQAPLHQPLQLLHWLPMSPKHIEITWKESSMTSMIHNGCQFFTTSNFHNFRFNGAIFKSLSTMPKVYQT